MKRVTIEFRRKYFHLKGLEGMELLKKLPKEASRTI